MIRKDELKELIYFLWGRYPILRNDFYYICRIWFLNEKVLMEFFLPYQDQNPTIISLGVSRNKKFFIDLANEKFN